MPGRDRSAGLARLDARTLASIVRTELQSTLTLAKTLPTELLPEFLGHVEVVRATALARLSGPSVTLAEVTLLEVPEAAARLSVSPGYLYRHSRQFAFSKCIGRKLLFSSRGIDEYIRLQRTR